MNFVKHGTNAGVNTYKSEDGRFYIPSAFSTQNVNVRAMRHRVWTAEDSTKPDPCCPKATADGCARQSPWWKARLAKYLASESE